MNSYIVELTHDATFDLQNIYQYIKNYDSLENAKYVVEQIKKAVSTLSEQPNRGNYTKELLVVGIKEFREIYFKPYRIVYTVIGKTVTIVLIADGRRDLQRILESRILY